MGVVYKEWLKDVVDRYSLQPSVLLKNPIDTKIYRSVNDQAHRKKHSIGLLYHTDEIKGVKYALEAIFKLKEKYEN